MCALVALIDVLPTGIPELFISAVSWSSSGQLTQQQQCFDFILLQDWHAFVLPNVSTITGIYFPLRCKGE